MTRQSAEIIAREMGGKVFESGGICVEIHLGEGTCVYIDEDKIEAINDGEVTNRIWIKKWNQD